MVSSVEAEGFEPSSKEVPEDTLQAYLSCDSWMLPLSLTLESGESGKVPRLAPGMTPDILARSA